MNTQSYTKIDKELIEFLKFHLGETNWNFDVPCEIVPNELNHKTLLNENKIDKDISLHYCLPSTSMVHPEELKARYEGRVTSLKPYSFHLFGAYHLRTHLIAKLEGILAGNDQFKVNGKPVKYLEDLIPYFKKYAEGFKVGFTGFVEDKINSPFLLNTDSENKVKKVFNFATSNSIGGSWTSWSSFAVNQDKEITGAFEDGKLQGYFYAAWCFIFSDSDSFAPLFKRRYGLKINGKIANADEVEAFLKITEYFKENYELKDPTKLSPEQLIKLSMRADKLLLRYTHTEITEYLNRIQKSLQSSLNLKQHGSVWVEKSLSGQREKTKTNDVKYSAKHYALAYILECFATGTPLPLGKKDKLEQIGNERIGKNKGNRFYKCINEITPKDLNSEQTLIEIAGDEWRKAVINLSLDQVSVDMYLRAKQL